MAEEKVTSEHSSREILISSLEVKDQYINELAQAIDEHNDLKIYQLLGPLRYRDDIDSDFKLKYGEYPFELVKDQRQELAHFLSDSLIDFLQVEFPFFYYQEVKLGEFEVYFGNWWDHRKFGSLDVLNVEFSLISEEMDKLSKTVALGGTNTTLNAEAINKLSKENIELQAQVDAQTDRDKQLETLRTQKAELAGGGLFESNRVKEDRQKVNDELIALEEENESAKEAPTKIKENKRAILEFSKEDTILGLERDSIQKRFNSFKDFENNLENLYVNYIRSFSEKK